MISVLYVDDEQSLLEIAKLFLEDTGDFRVGTALSAKTALTDDSIRSYDAIVSDYQMPGMDGIAFLKVIREKFGDIPFILFTGRGREEVVIEAINNGADFYLQKGGDPEAQFAELAHKIKQSVRRKQAEYSLHDSERRLADIIDFLPDATFAIDRNGKVIAWNRTIEEMTGIPASEMLGKGDYEYAIPFYSERRPMLLDLIDKPDEKISEFYTNVYRTGMSLTAETDHTHPKGNQMFVLAKACHLYNQAGEITGAIESIRDISERKKLEMDLGKKHLELQASFEQVAAADEELRQQYDELVKSELQIRESETRYRNMVENSPLGMHFYDLKPDGTLTFSGANPNADRILGVDHHRFIGQAIETAFPSLAGSEIPDRYKAVAEKGGLWHKEQIIYDGGEIRGIYAVIAFQTSPRSMVAMFEDITARKKADAEIQRISAELQLIFKNMINAFIVWESVFDENGRYVSFRFGRFNDAFARIAKVRQEDVLGKDVFEVWPDTEQSWVDVYGSVATTGVPKVFDMYHVSTKGWYHCNAYRPADSQAQVCVIFEDITERRQREEEIAFDHALLSAQQETSLDAILIVDENGKIINYNRQFITLWGLPEDLVAKREDEPVLQYVTRQLTDPEAFLARVRYLYEHREEKSSDELLLVDGRVLERFSSPMMGKEGKYYGRIWYFRDITPRKQAEQELKRSEERLRLFIRHAPAAIAMFDREMRYIAASRRWMADYHLGDHDITGQSHYETFPEISGEIKAIHRRALAGEVISADEDTFVRQDGSVQWLTWEVRPWFTAGNEIGGIIIYSEDITSRKHSEEALRESEQRFRNLIQNSSDMIRIIDKTGRIAYSSPSTLRLFGYAPAEIIGKDPLEYIHPDDRARVTEALQEVISRTNSGIPTEYRIRHKDGHYIDVEAVAGNQLQTPGINGIVVTARPITERKRAEDALRASEEKYRFLTENSIDIIYSMDLEGTVTHISPQVSRYGFMPDQLIGHTISEFIAEEDLPRIREDIRTTVATGQSTHTTFRLKGSPENPVWLEDNGTVIKKAGGVAVGISGVLRDITDRVRTEAALEKSEGWLYRLAEHAPDLIYRMSLPDGKYEYVSPASEEITGYAPEDFYADPGLIRKLIHPAWQDYFRKEWYALLENRAPPFYEFQIIDRAGNTRWLNQRNILVYDSSGKPVAIEGIVTDITRQKTIERELRRSELRSLAVSANAGEWIWEVDPEGMYRYSSPAVTKILGYRPDELVGKMHFYDLFDPTVRDDLKNKALSAFTSNEPFRDFENLNRHKNGTPVLMSTSGTPVFDDDGTFIGYCGVDEDITLRAASQSALQAMVRSMVGTTGLDSLKRITENVSAWLQAECVMVGEIQPDRETVKVLAMLLDGKTIEDFTYSLRDTPCENASEKGFCLYTDNVQNAFPHAKDLLDLNIRGYAGTSLRNSGGEVIGILCALSRSPLPPTPAIHEIMDILAVKAAAEIERARIEEALLKSRHQLSEAMDLANLVHWEYDVATDRFTFDDRFYALYGTTAEREGGSQMSSETYAREFVHPDDAWMVAEEVKKAFETTDPQYVSHAEHRIIRRDGTVRTISVRIAVTKDKSGRTIQTHGANQDITERKQAEEALRQAHKKLHLLTGITRHDIGNQLMALNGFVGLLHKKVTDPAMETYFTRITEAQRLMTAMIAFTKEYEKIGVHAPAWQAPAAVVDEAAMGILPGQIVLNNTLPRTLEILADPLIVKVFFNLLDNSIRHGQRVTEITVSSRTDNENLVLVWEDNGIGIGRDEKEQIFERGFGKNTGLGMFLVREILSLTGIVIRETGEPFIGARFEMTVPRGAYRTAIP